MTPRFPTSIVVRTALCLALAGSPCLLDAAKPLSQAAESAAKTIAKGVIVTAEGNGGEVKYGIAGKGADGKVAPEKMVFEIGSITKVFTALLLAQAVSEGKVTLDTTLADLLGNDQTFADSRVGKITLRQLATHTSGLPRLPANLQERSTKDPYTNYDRDKLTKCLEEMHLEGEPPYEPEYSNFGVGLLGDLLSRVYEKPWETLIAERITGPLGMKDTAATLGHDQKARFVTPYSGGAKVEPWTFKALAGCGALHSTAADLVIFGQALLHPETTPFKDAILLMEKPQSKDGEYGLALMLSQLGGQPVYEHNGGTAGFRSALQVFPATDTIRVVLSNNALTKPERILADARGEAPRTKDSGKTLTNEELSAYTGVYKLNPRARNTVLLRDGQLWSQITGQAFLRLFPHEDEDRFFLKSVAAEVQFNREAGNGVTSLTLHQYGRNIKATKTADPVPEIKFPSVKELQAYTGTYELGPDAAFTLKVQNSTLFAQLSGQPFAPVFMKKDDWFEYDNVPAALEFQRDTEGKVIALQLHQNGQTQRAVKK